MKLSLILIIFFLPLFLVAQQPIDKLIIDSNNDSIPFLDLVKKVEQEYPVKFFFGDTWLDSIIVKQSSVPISLSKLLNESFKDLTLNYFMDGSNIIITDNYKINSTLPKDFFYVNRTTTKHTADAPNIEYAFIAPTENKNINKKSKIVNIGNPANVTSKSNCVISGTVRNEEDGDPIIGAQIFIKQSGRGTVTDGSGYYILNLPQGHNEILFKYLGREDATIPAEVYNDGTLNVNMKKSNVLINEVTVTSDKKNNVKNLNIGIIQLDMQKVKQLPATLGEVDIIKTALLLPGVQSVGEGASGFNVRGGSADQNLMLFDDAPIFNTSHLFGFFSVFNPETVNDFKLYKSGIPANYGGRVSSVFDVRAKQGNLKKYEVSGGISPITGKLTIEGPIIKDKLSFIIGGRSTYSDWILRKIDTPQFKKSAANFHDVSAKLSYQINENNSLEITAYQSQDYFKLNSDTAYNYENRCARISFKHFFTQKFYTKLSAIYSNYQYNITSDEVPATSFKLNYNIEYKSLKADAYYFPNSKHTVNFGTEAIRYDMTPGDFTPLSSNSDIAEFRLPNEQGIETGLYVSDEFKISTRLTVSCGLRYAAFFVLGPYKEYQYNPYVPRSIESRMDSTIYSSNEVVKTYGGPEVRLSARYILGANNSIKLSYNRLHQFIHMLTNSSAISPTDVWKISDAVIKPLIGDQIAIGYYHNILNNTIEASAEMYYKQTINNLDYKSGTELLLNPNLEVSLLSGIGRAYGFELMLEKKKGKLNGWLSYTYSKSELKVNGKYSEERINKGEYYPSDYDKTHNINLVTNYNYSRRYSLSSTFCYSTGRPISYPVAKYNFRDNQLIHYSNRNEYRIPDYMRWDISLNIFENMKANKVTHNSWSIGVYNVLGIKNAYSVFFKSTPKGIKGYQLSVFARPVFNLTYNFRF